MAKQGLYVTDIPELGQVWRPLHQYKWSVWEEREEIKFPHKPGFPKVLNNGQEFAIAKNGSTALARGLCVKSSSAVIDITDLPEAPDLLSGKVVIDIPTTHATEYAEDYFQDGYLYVKSGTGAGLNFPVARSEAIPASPASATNVTITIDGEIFVELDTTSDVTLISSPYRNVGLSSVAEGFGGLPPDEVSADAYFWLQTKGPAVGISSGDIVKGVALAPTTGGKFTTAVAGQRVVAHSLEGASADDYFQVFLTG